MKPLSLPLAPSTMPLLPPLHPPPIRAENTPIRKLRAWSFPREDVSYQETFQAWWLTGTFEFSKESRSFVRSLKCKRKKLPLFEAVLSLPVSLPPVEPCAHDNDPLSRLALRHLALGVFDVQRVAAPSTPPPPEPALSRSALRRKPPPPKVLGEGFVLSWLFVAPNLSSSAQLAMASEAPLSSESSDPPLALEAVRIEDLIRYTPSLALDDDFFCFFETATTLHSTFEESVQEVDAAHRYAIASQGKIAWYLRPLSWGFARKVLQTYGG